MKILMKTILPIAAATSFAVTSCLNDKTNSISEENYEDRSLKQAELDSAAYRNIFNLTHAAKDSVKVCEFNNIAAAMKSSFNEIDCILTDSGISPEEYKMENFQLSDKDTSCVYQHFADNWMYRNFFTKIGIMSDSIAKKCDEAEKQTRPR